MALEVGQAQKSCRRPSAGHDRDHDHHDVQRAYLRCQVSAGELQELTRSHSVEVPG